MEKERKREVGEGKGEGRGGEMRKGIVIGGMILGLLLGCNNGIAELEKEKESILSMSNLRQGFLDVFETFGNMLSGAFGITKETAKKDVGDHFDGLSKKIQEVLEKVKQLTTNTDDSKEAQGDGLSVAVNKASEVLTKLKTNLDLLANIGGGESVKVGEVDSGNKQGVGADAAELKKAHKALREIVAAAKSVDIKAPQKSSVVLTDTGVDPTPQNGAKILTTGAHAGAGATVGDKASLIVSAVSGEAMLDAIVKSKDTDADSGVAGSANDQTSALAFAKGGNEGNLAQAGINPSAGIALRSLVKDGKLASKNSDVNDIKSVQLVGATAVSKLVNAVEDLIIKTVNKTLESVKQAVTTAKSNGLNSKEK